MSTSDTVVRAQVTHITRKLVIGLLLFGGVFVIIAALFRCVLSLWHIESVNTSNLWATRESVCSFPGFFHGCSDHRTGYCHHHGQHSMHLAAASEVILIARSIDWGQWNRAVQVGTVSGDGNSEPETSRTRVYLGR